MLFFHQKGDCTTSLQWEITKYNVQAVMSYDEETKYNNGKNYQCKPSQLILSDKTYILQSMHVHIGSSEHVLYGTGWSGWSRRQRSSIRSSLMAELHLIHHDINDSNQLSVVGIMIQQQPENDSTDTNKDQQSTWNSILSSWLYQWQQVAEGTRASCTNKNKNNNHNRRHRQMQSPRLFIHNSTKTVTPNRKMENNLEQQQQEQVSHPYDLLHSLGMALYFHQYWGSLTTPPCRQGILWHVLETPIPIRTSQYQWLQQLVTGYINPNTCQVQTSAASPNTNSTVRPLQQRHHRTIRRICPTTSAQNVSKMPAIIVTMWIIGIAAGCLALVSLMLWIYQQRQRQRNQKYHYHFIPCSRFLIPPSRNRTDSMVFLDESDGEEHVSEGNHKRIELLDRSSSTPSLPPLSINTNDDPIVSASLNQMQQTRHHRQNRRRWL